MTKLKRALISFIGTLTVSSPALADHCTATDAQIKGVQALKYSPEPPTERGQLLILPPTGGVNFADKSLAKAICLKGYPVLIVDYAQPDGLTTDFKIHDKITIETLESLRRVLEVENRPTVIFGASLGGLYAQIALGLKDDPRFPAFAKVQGAILTVAGGSLAEILASSQQSGVQEQRKLRLGNADHMELELYELQLYQQIEFDPLTLASPRDRDRVLFFGSTADDIVPSKTQRQLWEKLDRPKVVWFDNNHVVTMGKVYFLQRKLILEHLQKTLGF